MQSAAQGSTVLRWTDGRRSILLLGLIEPASVLLTSVSWNVERGPLGKNWFLPPDPTPRDEMDLLAFTDFVLAWDHRSHPAAIKYFFDIFDLKKQVRRQASASFGALAASARSALGRAPCGNEQKPIKHCSTQPAVPHKMNSCTVGVHRGQPPPISRFLDHLSGNAWHCPYPGRATSAPWSCTSSSRRSTTCGSTCCTSTPTCPYTTWWTRYWTWSSQRWVHILLGQVVLNACGAPYGCRGVLVCGGVRRRGGRDSGHGQATSRTLSFKLPKRLGRL